MASCLISEDVDPMSKRENKSIGTESISKQFFCNKHETLELFVI